MTRRSPRWKRNKEEEKMADVIKTATRDAYGKALVELAGKNDKLIVLDADLAAATKTGMFKKEYPDRFYDCGIAEANMMGVAAGLSTAGFTVFASSFAMFAATWSAMRPMNSSTSAQAFAYSGES